MRIAQICSAREAIYGAVVSMVHLSEGLRDAGDHVHMITFRGKRFGGQMRAKGFPVREVRVRMKVDPWAAARMAKSLREEQIQIVHTHLSTSSLVGAMAARFARIPSVGTVHGLSGRLSYVWNRHIIAVSEEVKAHLIAQGERPDRVSVVYNGIDIPPWDYDSAAARAMLGWENDGPIIGTVSRITAAKGITDCIRVVHALKPEFPQIRYLLVGDGDQLDEVRALITDLGLDENVSCVGYQEAVYPYLAGMDVFLFASRKEAMGIALVEAMVAGLPIVATRVGGIPEVVTSDVGRLHSVGDIDGMVRSTRDYLTNPSLRIGAGASGRSRAVGLFSRPVMVQRTRAVYQKMLGQTPQPAGSEVPIA